MSADDGDNIGRNDQCFIPSGSVSVTTTLVLAQRSGTNQEPPLDALFAGTYFTLDSCQDGAYVDGFVFDRLITITLHYDDQAFAHMDESKLELRYWDGTQ